MGDGDLAASEGGGAGGRAGEVEGGAALEEREAEGVGVGGVDADVREGLEALGTAEDGAVLLDVVREVVEVGEGLAEGDDVGAEGDVDGFDVAVFRDCAGYGAGETLAEVLGGDLEGLGWNVGDGVVAAGVSVDAEGGGEASGWDEVDGDVGGGGAVGVGDGALDGTEADVDDVLGEGLAGGGDGEEGVVAEDVGGVVDVEDVVAEGDGGELVGAIGEGLDGGGGLIGADLVEDEGGLGGGGGAVGQVDVAGEVPVTVPLWVRVTERVTVWPDEARAATAEPV